MKESKFPVQTPKYKLSVFNDERGSLIPCTFSESTLWTPKRFFYVCNVPVGEVRGKHAHKRNHQALFCLQGEIEIYRMFIYKGALCTNSQILETGEWAYHPAKEWAEIKFIKEGSVMLSLCSEEYDPDDYLHTKQEWIEYMKI